MKNKFNYLAKQLDREILMLNYHIKSLEENIKIFGSKHSVTEMTKGCVRERAQNVIDLKEIMISLGYHKTYVALRYPSSYNAPQKV